MLQPSKYQAFAGSGRKSDFLPSSYQQAIFEWIQTGSGHAFVDAAAGAGKSTTLVQAAGLLPRSSRALFCAFNRHITKELRHKLDAVGSSMECRTIHSLGRGALFTGLKIFRGAAELGEPSGKKYTDLCRDYINVLASTGKLNENLYNLYEVASQLKSLVDFARLTMTTPTDENLLTLIEHYDLDIDTSDKVLWPIISTGVQVIIDAGAELYKAGGIIDHTDMVFLPNYLNIPSKKYDWIFIDESQDLNAAQLQLVLRALPRDGKGQLLFVGDRRQSLYGFAGADTHSVDTIIQRCSAQVFPLSICYRCPASHIELAQQVYPGIEAKPDAAPGTIEIIQDEQVSSLVGPGDYIICRTTAPVVKRCLALLRSNRKALVLGKDLGKNFIDLIEEKLSKKIGFCFQTLMECADQYRREQINILSAKEGTDLQISELNDKVDTLDALHTAYLAEAGKRNATLDGFIAHIRAFFKPEEDEEGKKIDYSHFIVCCTVHKAKGLEAENIFIESPDLFPHPAAKKDWQREQEYNIEYVALTRSQDKLYFIGCLPGNLHLQPTLVDEMLAVPELIDVDAMLSDVMTEEAEKQPAREFTFFLREKDNLVVAADLSAKHEHPGGVMTQMYITYEAIGCRYGADRNQIGPMTIAQYEVNSYQQVDEMVARRIHPELFGYLAEKYGWLSPLVARTNTKGDIKLGDRVTITPAWLPETTYHGAVKRIDTDGVASGDDCYLVKLDGQSLMDYFCEGSYQVRPEAEATANEGKLIWSRDAQPVMTTEEASGSVAQPEPKRRGPKSSEPTKKKDFRFPVRLLEALKSAADEDGMSDTEFLMSLLKSDKRIQSKLGVMTEECEV